MNKQHKSVLLQEVIKYLQPRENTNFVDATLGFAGHAKQILEKTGPNGILIGIDQDKQALAEARTELSEFGERFKFYYGNFENIDEAVNNEKITGGILADLGVSSMQLDKENRGFSFQKSGPLDMRMNLDSDLTAAKIVNTYTEDELSKLIYRYSDEKFATRIAKRIVEAREKAEITDTKDLAEIVSEAIPRKFWPKGINPATRTFQAIRIAVNDELGVLERFLPKAVEVLEPGARLGIITFHGLEDKIVKDFFKNEVNPCKCPPTFPKCVCGQEPKVRLVTKRGVKPTEEEIKDNPRSRSAKLRVIEKL